MYGAMYFAMALGMSSAATTRSSKRNTMVAVVSWMKEEKQKNNKTQERRPKSQLTAQCTCGTSKKETMTLELLTLSCYCLTVPWFGIFAGSATLLN